MFRSFTMVAVVLVTTLLSVPEAQAQKYKIRPSPKERVTVNRVDPLKGSLPRTRAIKFGDKGHIFDGQIVQVLSDKLVLVRIFYQSAEGPSGYSQDVIKPDLALVVCDTKGMVDGKEWASRERFEVTGTVKYDTAEGTTRTVWRLEPLKEGTSLQSSPNSAKQ